MSRQGIYKYIAIYYAEICQIVCGLLWPAMLLDSCTFSPGLSNKLNWHIYYSAGLNQSEKVQSCCVILGFITQSKILYWGLERELFTHSPNFLPSWASFIPEGFAPQVYSPLSLYPDQVGHALEPTQLCCACLHIFVFIVIQTYRGSNSELERRASALTVLSRFKFQLTK